MKFRKYLFWVTFLYINAEIYAQVITPEAISTQGGTFINANGIVSYTLGQAFGGTLQAGNNILSVGFIPAENNIAFNWSSAIGPLSPGAQIGIPFTTSAVYIPGNIFTVQLSDSLGSFSDPVNIGSDTSVISGIIVVTIPTTTTSGLYRLRVVSSTPVYFSIPTITFTIYSLFGSVYVMQFINGVDQDTIYLTDSLKFTTPQYYYASTDSVYFSYHVIDPLTGSEVVNISPVKYTSDGFYVADNLSALTSGNSYKLEFLLYNGYRYSFTLKKN